jgi:dolichyl-phosphate-mannose--protein O-mannosyl transferase
VGVGLRKLPRRFLPRQHIYVDMNRLKNWKYLFFAIVLISICLPKLAADLSGDDEAGHDHSQLKIPPELQYVTCGSLIKLQNIGTGYRLHSHPVNYGSGSGQQSVTGMLLADDPNSFWILKGPHHAPCKLGDRVKNGDQIRLLHYATNKNLHSHLHPSPLSNQQEVSAFSVDDRGNGDSGDHWKVEFSGEYWKRSDIVTLQHVDTGKYLQMNKRQYGHPIPGQLEVACTDEKNEQTQWRTEEGIYFPAKLS